jgi:hypothetical protein
VPVFAVRGTDAQNAVFSLLIRTGTADNAKDNLSPFILEL